MLDYNWTGSDTSSVENMALDTASMQDIATSLKDYYSVTHTTLVLPTFGDARGGFARFPTLKAHLRVARRLKHLQGHVEGMRENRPSMYGMAGTDLVEVLSEESFVFTAKTRGALVLGAVGVGKTTMAHYLLAAWAAENSSDSFWAEGSKLVFQLVFFVPLDRLPNADFVDLADLLHCL
jgi:hypothetical protein